MADLVTAPDADDDDDEWVPRRRFGRGHRIVALIAAVAVLLTAVATVFVTVRREGTSVELYEPTGSGPEDLQRFNALVAPQGTIDGISSSGPVDQVRSVELVVVGRIAGFRLGRLEVNPPELALADRPLVTMDVAVDEVRSGSLPVGSGGRLHVEIGMWRRDSVTPRTIASVAPGDGSVVLYLGQAPGNGPDGALPRFRDPAGGRPAGQPLWWTRYEHGFYVTDGAGGLVELGPGRELPATRVADVLPPEEAWPVIDPAPPLDCAPGDGIAGRPVPPGWPVLAAPEPTSGRAPRDGAPPPSPTLGQALDAFGRLERTWPPADVVAPLGAPPAVPGYRVELESLTNRTVAYRDAEGRVQAVFYGGGSEEAGWRFGTFQACNAWYETLPNPALDVQI